MQDSIKDVKDVTIVFAGDSGDGMQLTGNEFTQTNALYGNDVATFPNFPAEIRAPIGTLAGVSGFQLKFGSEPIFTPGDDCDVLVAMNAAGLISNLHKLKRGGKIIANTSGFDKRNLALAKAPTNPLEDEALKQYEVIEIDVTKLTREALKDSDLGKKDIDRSKNMFILGYLYWMYNRTLEGTIAFIEQKFSKKPELIEANTSVLKSGYHYGDTTETFTSRYEVKAAKLNKGTYRNIMGNKGTAIGLIAAAQKSGLDLFYGSYPITPASDILHELSAQKHFGVKTYQAEDEIAAICAAIGAAYGGKLAVTASAGPGVALKGEALGLAVMLEIPLVLINVQRGGPSTGLPTKTEQSDLMQALYGRNGEAPAVVIAAKRPSDCFDTVYEACRIAVEHMTPVIFLSDGYIANGSEPWKVLKSDNLREIKPPMATPEDIHEERGFLPYLRNKDLIRKWAIPGMKGMAHRIGGLEKEDLTGNVSYDPENHQHMTRIRAEKVAKVANTVPPQDLDQGEAECDVLVLGWGSTYGAIKTAVQQLLAEGKSVAHAHVRYLNPLPRNLDTLLNSAKAVLIPEINDKQFYHIIRSTYFVDAEPLNKIKGLPFSSDEIKAKIEELLASK